MSYVDGNAGSSRRALTGGAVLLIEAGLALALVKGLTVAFTTPEPPPHLTSQFFPTAPLPPKPVEQPKLEPKHRLEQKAIDPPERPTRTLPDNNKEDFTLPETGGFSTGGDTTDEDLFAKPQSREAPARFVPRTARPQNDVARWVTTDDYPTSDVRAGHTGTVRFSLAIDPFGRVTSCTVTQSSGYPGLDAATCRNVSKRARFNPATDEAGEKVIGSYNGSIRWMIPRD